MKVGVIGAGTSRALQRHLHRVEGFTVALCHKRGGRWRQEQDLRLCQAVAKGKLDQAEGPPLAAITLA